MIQTLPPPISDFFPMPRIREAQKIALEFIQDSYQKGFRDIIIAAPTGIGKSGIGAAAAFWASSLTVPGFEKGCYYLVTQKMLQDQMEADFPGYIQKFRTRGASLKSSTEYPCPSF